MNPIDPDDDFPSELEVDPGLPQPLEPLPQPKPNPPIDGGTGSVDLSGIGDGATLVEGVAEVGSAGIDAATELGGAALDAAGTVADAAGSALEGAGSALEAAGGCADGCGGCSLAILVTLFAAAGTAVAIFR
jgi:hypothetical protein